MTAWPSIADDSRHAMLCAVESVEEITTTLGPLKPIILAVERAGTKADNDVARALLACEANRRQRKARRARQ
jgi:hypothetical protein